MTNGCIAPLVAAASHEAGRASIHDFEPMDVAACIASRNPLVAEDGEANHGEVYFEPGRLLAGFRVPDACFF